MRKRIFTILAAIAALLGHVQPALAAALGPGQYSAPDPNISYTNITGIGYHASGDPFYEFDAASWSVVGGDQVRIHKHVWGGGGTLCMDGSVCQSFGYYDTFLAMDLPDRGVHTLTMTNGIITFVGVVVDDTPPTTSPSLSGAAGSGGWYRSPVDVALSAVDSPGAFPSIFASGVAGVFVNGGAYGGPVTLGSDGAHVVTFYSTDNRGNTEPAQSLNVNIDAAPPTTTASVSGAMGNAGWYISPVSIALASTDATSGVGSVMLDGAPYSSPVTFSTQGAVTASYQATDNAGNVEPVQGLSFQIDTVPPVTTITSPVEGSFALGSVLLSGTASDATSGVAAVELSADNGATWSGTTLSGGTWSYALDTSPLPDGPLGLQARAIDVAGNVETSSGIFTLVVDNTPPAITLAGPASFCPLCGETASLAYAVGDATSGVANWTLSADGGQTLASGLTDASSSFDWDGSSLDPGPHTIRLAATDEAGNTSEQTLTVVIAPPAPPDASILITCPLPGEGGWCKAPATVTLSGSVVGLSIEQLSYTYEGESRTYNGGELSFEEGRPGPHDIRLHVTDSWGRISSEAAGQFKVDGAVPLVAFGGATESTLALSVSDADSGIVRWTAQVFDADGKSVFWQEGDGAFSGELNWSPAHSGNYFIDIFARDAAGHEAGLVRAPFTVTVPAPIAVVREFVELFAPPIVATLTPTPTYAASPSAAPTQMPTEPTLPEASPAGFAIPTPSPSLPPPAYRRVSGAVFLDANRNSIRDVHESGLAGVAVEAVAEGTVIASATTRADGVYQLSLPQGRHCLLRIVAPNGYVLTTSLIAVAESDGDTRADFGLSASRFVAHASLLGLFGVLMAWSVAAIADRRAEAVKALAAELEAVHLARASARVRECGDS